MSAAILLQKPQSWTGICSLLLLAWSIIEPDRNTQTGARQQVGPTRLYFGTEACSQCHTNPPEGSNPILCRCSEYPVWRDEDKHKDAYQVLSEARGQQIGKLLEKDVLRPETGCVSCHGMPVSEDPLLRHSSFKLEDGVSCAACHGFYKEWVSKHGDLLERDAWRKLSRTDKEERFGMTDLWDPAKRTKLCASCHIGNAEEGKFVTHEMYASGHPPLPGFEVATFCDSMPRHWELLREKEKSVQELLSYDSAELEQVTLVLVSAAVSLRETMNLIALQAERCVEAGPSPESVLDFANFDCYACHHDLRLPGWRRHRGYTVSPGRPMPRPWPAALVNLAVQHVERDEAAAQAQMIDFNERMRNLAIAFDARPFGEPAAVAVAAADVSGWADALVRKLQDPATQYTQTAAKRLLKEMCSLSGAERFDYDSARQIAWAFRIIYGEVQPKPARHSEIEKKTRELARMFPLPSGPEKQFLDELGSTLQLIADYDPVSFKAQLDELARLFE